MACSVRIIFTLASFSLLLPCFQAQGAATSVPHQLYGKSVTTSRSWQQVYEDETGQGKTMPFQSTDSFYFSSLGRIFTRHLIRVSRASRTYEQVGPDPNKVQHSTSATGGGQRPFGTGIGTFQDLHFEGRTLIAIARGGENTAIRLAIEFDQNFGTCTVSAVYGTDNGKPGRYISWTGGVRRVISRQLTSQPSCVVRDGNTFE
jgi:hypothetical protein